MGEWTHYRPGDRAPNDGTYIEIGERVDNVNDPQQVSLSKGQRFPETSNHNRKWKKKK
ncbi:YjzC family protein [Paenibacillus sp. GCM10027626]|uniref:YjzC family protein n=1 Tax=Paenibacillus sp. GCM10027626 TaxID=3273411 RepID=UPI0036302EF7